MTDKCAFCDKFKNNNATVMMFEPLNPVTPGHMLVVPREHIWDFTESPVVTAAVMAQAAEWAEEMDTDMNLITSKGEAATQTVFHFHVHLVPRTKGDGLTLPWTNQEQTHA